MKVNKHKNIKSVLFFIIAQKRQPPQKIQDRYDEQKAPAHTGNYTMYNLNAPLLVFLLAWGSQCPQWPSWVTAYNILDYRY